MKLECGASDTHDQESLYREYFFKLLAWTIYPNLPQVVETNSPQPMDVVIE